MEKSRTAVGILFLAMVFLWLCCWAYALPNTTTTATNNDTDRQFTEWPRDPSPCENAFDHCSRSPNDNANGTRLQPTGKLVPAGPREKLNYEDYHQSRCYCDSQCRKYGDCCPDEVADEVDAIERYFANGSHQMEQDPNLSAVVWECRHLPLHDNEFMYIYTIGSCPTEYPLSSIHKKCLRSIAKDDYDYQLDLPVISTETNLTYSNIFCAMCHNDSKVHKWKINFLCPVHNCTKNVNLWKYRPGENMWDYDNNSNDKVLYEIAFSDIDTANNSDYQDMFEAQKCRGGVVDTCPPSWTGVKERKLCAAYTYYIKIPNNYAIYKNVHCAKCHLEEEFECPTFSKGGLPYDGTIPFNCLFEVSFNNPRRCMHERMIGCKKGEVWNPEKLSCLPSTCGRNYRMDDNGKCVKRIKAKS